MSTTETGTATRFTLDEARAAEWLAREIAQHLRWVAGDTDEVPELEIGASYDPCDWSDHGHDTQSVLYYARAGGIVTGPGSIEFDYVDDGDAGYTWIVYLDGPGDLKLSTYYSKLKHLGNGARGAEAALGVLREAVDAANGLLDDLDAYMAARFDGSHGGPHICEGTVEENGVCDRCEQWIVRDGPDPDDYDRDEA